MNDIWYSFFGFYLWKCLAYNNNNNDINDHQYWSTKMNHLNSAIDNMCVKLIWLVMCADDPWPSPEFRVEVPPGCWGGAKVRGRPVWEAFQKVLPVAWHAPTISLIVLLLQAFKVRTRTGAPPRSPSRICLIASTRGPVRCYRPRGTCSIWIHVFG